MTDKIYVDNSEFMELLDEGLLNRFKIHSNNDILSKYTCDSCGDRTESVCFDEDKDINECMDCM